ncbi:hypothetical protein AYO20_02644 [Fonsecaea nubica]|uniref:Acyl-CoA thioesterase II n=1 Tax=Fonsecaea nubica TaxID=856822 RepID=A0A178D9B4_9EURO|nr:hypothetical protein AYO20_02644 [Fonsecaea nubica]OAL38192.1 hypothetical protein AYO20_02644 [Fonsecaea nubica]
MEEELAITQRPEIGRDVFTHACPPWLPPGARGLYGGVLVGGSLAAAQSTVPPELLVHSSHCNFLIGASAQSPIFYHVERVRDGRSFATRRVDAMQDGKCIFTATLSFMRPEGQPGQSVSHAHVMPHIELPEEVDSQEGAFQERPFQVVDLPITPAPYPTKQKLRRLIRIQRRIDHNKNHSRNPDTNHAVSSAVQSASVLSQNLGVLAYLSDFYVINTATRVYGLPMFSPQSYIERSVSALNRSETAEKEKAITHLQNMIRTEKLEMKRMAQVSLSTKTNNLQVGMMVTLSHTVFFHNQQAVRPHEWMLFELKSPWAGDNRGIAVQRTWNKEGLLIMTCVQEGLIRTEPRDKSLL